MDEKRIKSIIEAMLFTWGDPLNINNISEILDLSKEFIRKCIIDMKNEYESDERGLQIIEVNSSFQLCTNSIYYDYIQRLCTPSQSKGLTQAALEILSIIAYKQPITRHEIEMIRGVKSDKAIGTLLEKELIVENGRLEKTGRPIIYGTTENFLKSFGLSSLDELPSIEFFGNLEFNDSSVEKAED